MLSVKARHVRSSCIARHVRLSVLPASARQKRKFAASELVVALVLKTGSLTALVLGSCRFDSSDSQKFNSQGFGGSRRRSRLNMVSFCLPISSPPRSPAPCPLLHSSLPGPPNGVHDAQVVARTGVQCFCSKTLACWRCRRHSLHR